MERKVLIKFCFTNLSFSASIAKYDYFVEGKLNYILSEEEPIGHYYRIIALNDGRIISNYETNDDLVIWDLKNRNFKTLPLDNAIYDFAALDNKIVVTSSKGTAKVWNVDTLECEQTLHGHEDYVISISLYDKVLITADNSSIIVWKLLDNKYIVDYVIDYDGLEDFIVLKNNKILAYNSRSFSIYNQGRLEKSFDTRRRITDLAELKDNRIAISSGDKIRIYDLSLPSVKEEAVFRCW